MIGLSHIAGSRPDWLSDARIAISLGLFAGQAADAFRQDSGVATHLRGPRAAPDPNWRPARGPAGTLCLFEGWIDNRRALAQRCGLTPDASDAALFAHLVEEFGSGTDALVHGSYAAICVLPNRHVRLSRSPWGGPSLFWAKRDDVILAASLPRALFAAGFPRRLKAGQLADALYHIDDDTGGYWYEGVQQVPQGSIVSIGPDGVLLDRWYDPLALETAPHCDDAEVEREADALLDAAVAAALSRSRKPGLLLSGGLDSGLLADAMLRAMPAQARLPSYTFVPGAGLSLDRRPGMVTDERAAVERYAAMHPRLDPHFAEPDAADDTAGFDARAEAFFAATDTGPAARIASTALHPCFRAAARDGCDWLFDAGCGNDTLSQDARWAHVEFLRRGHWGELRALAAVVPPGDTRSMARRFAARSLMPLLPGVLRRLARLAVHGQADMIARNASMVSAEADARLRRRAAATADLATGEWPHSRREWVADFWRGMDRGTEIHHGFEQVFGIRQRDVMANRALIEFCLGLPTEQFVRRGRDRFLARRLAQGRMPEAQRLEQRLGLFNADRHARLTPRRAELRAALAAMEDHPELGALIDFERAYTLLREWPEDAPADPRAATAFLHALPGAIMVGRFARWYDGTN